MLRLLGVTLLSALAGMTALAQSPSVCPAGTYALPGSVNQCVDRCPSPLLGYKGMCVQMCPTGTLVDPMTVTCVSVCPTGTAASADGVCQPQQNCPPDTVSYQGSCVPMNFICQMTIPGSYYNGQDCVCPLGYWNTRDRNATSVKGFCAPVPANATSASTPPPINCESYIANTFYSWQYYDCQCLSRYPVIVRNPADPILPFSCAVAGTPSGVPPCVPPMYFSFPEAACVNVTVPLSPSPRPSQTATASPVKKNAGETPTPSMTAKPSQRAIQDPTPSDTMTPKPSERPVDTSAAPTPKPSERPVETSAAPTPKPSERPVETSAAPTPKPSERPVETSAAPTPKPSERPVEPSARPSFSAKPTQRPDIIWAVDVTRLPLPSRRPLPSYSQRPLQQSAKPTPWRPRDPLPSDMPLPPYIQSSVKFPGANATKMQQPEVIQDIQASLACVLNMALDNIRIQNITIRRAGAAPVIIDASTMPLLRGNASGCFRAVAAPRLLRGLQATDSSVDVDYYIVEPNADILALSTSEFSTILSNSAPMADIAASVGSSGVSAVATEGSGSAAAPAPAATTTTNSNGIQLGSLIGGVVGGIALCVAAFTVYKLATRGRQPAAPLRSSTVSHSRVILVDNTNPLQIGMQGTSHRQVGYAPNQIRSSV
jgi:hypothetical protein